MPRPTREIDLEALLEDEPTREYPKGALAQADDAPSADAAEIVARLVEDAETLIRGNCLRHAVDLLELVVILEPSHEIARTRLRDVTGTPAARPAARPAREDDTVRIERA